MWDPDDEPRAKRRRRLREEQDGKAYGDAGGEGGGEPALDERQSSVPAPAGPPERASATLASRITFDDTPTSRPTGHFALASSQKKYRSSSGGRDDTPIGNGGDRLSPSPCPPAYLDETDRPFPRNGSVLAYSCTSPPHPDGIPSPRSPVYPRLTPDDDAPPLLNGNDTSGLTHIPPTPNELPKPSGTARRSHHYPAASSPHSHRRFDADEREEGEEVDEDSYASPYSSDDVSAHSTPPKDHTPRTIQRNVAHVREKFERLASRESSEEMRELGDMELAEGGEWEGDGGTTLFEEVEERGPMDGEIQVKGDVPSVADAGASTGIDGFISQSRFCARLSPLISDDLACA